MKNKLIITAANGFLGKALVQFFKKDYDIIALVRKPIIGEVNVKYVLWDGKTMGDWAHELEGAEAVINLAGRSVDCRYTEKNKQEIFSSRLESTQVIADAINQCRQKPLVWLNSASATIYRHSLDKPMTEHHGEYGRGFSVDVCQQWEQKFFDNKIEHVRQVALRTAIVLGKQGGVMKPFLKLAKYGLGGKMGNGLQQFSWIHIQDFCKAIEFLIEKEQCKGVYNLSSPNPITNKHFMNHLRNKIGIPFGIPTPKWMLEIGARLIQTETELILKSRYVIPEKLMQDGFQFEYAEIENAIDEIVS